MVRIYKQINTLRQSFSINKETVNAISLVAALCIVNVALLTYSLVYAKAWYSISLAIGMIAWGSSIYAIHHKKLRKAYLIAGYTLYLMIATSTVHFGLSSGIQFLFWPLACLFALDTRIRVYSALLFAFLCLVALIVTTLHVPEHTAHALPSFSFQLVLITGGLLIARAVMASRNIYESGNEKLKLLVNTDALTGLYNRRYFSTFLDYQNTIAIREKRSYCLAMGDIDHFKSINDRHGHDAGDKVLVSIANCFEKYLAHNDAVCRWGGEEFLIFLPESNAHKGFLVLEALRDVIDTLDIDGLSTSMSFGLVETNGKKTHDQVLKRCDELLYEAKKSGRNTIKFDVVG